MEKTSRINEILNHPDYRKYLNRIEKLETERRFCRHNMAHFLDVARIAYIRNFELELKIDKELIYGFALLHDIGRWCEYENGEAHDVAGARLAREILEDTSYHDYDIDKIVEAILGHRDNDSVDGGTFIGLMNLADKASRACYDCKANEDCYWSDEKKNMTIEL